MAEQSIIEAVQRYLKALQQKNLPVTFAVLFGSQAKGTATLWSDIDLMVVSPRFNAPRDREDITLLWRVAAVIDSRIEPIPCGDRQWREDKRTPIVEIARREGMIVAPEGA